jgi:glycosyltransferase involved in cell wall biosynthesis
LVERKGIKNLVQAMPRILTTMPKVMLVVVGDGPERDRLKEEVRRLGLSGNVIFAGKVAENKLLRLYEISDVFVLPAIVDSDGNTEGLGVVLLEAMSTQKPVVASRVGGIPEVVVHKQTGILVEPGNPDELARAITYLLKNDQTSVKMGRKGRQRAEQIFDWNLIASSFLELLASRGLANINITRISGAEKAVGPRLAVPAALNHDVKC